jgi:ABC-2 type transport system ATP-binding protein
MTAPNSVPIVETANLTKVYREGFWLNQKVTSLRNFSLTVYQGETFGLLGPNGAGKTTCLKILLDIIQPTSGKALVMGKPIGDRSVKQRIGYLPENAYLYDYLTGWEFLEFTAGLFHRPTANTQGRIKKLLDLVGLSQQAAKNKPMKKYSKGMLQRVGLAQALINDPELIFLDEPMSGLDPAGRYQIREIIKALREEGKTIFFNSHILADVEEICDRVAILINGNLVSVGSLTELLGDSDRYEVTVAGGNKEILRRWIPELQNKQQMWQGELLGDPQEFIGSLQLMGGILVNMKLKRPSLEEYFIAQLDAVKGQSQQQSPGSKAQR